VAAIARRLGTRRGAMLARDLGMYRLLAHLQTGPELSEFLREQLGALLDHDAAHGTELLRTLDAHLATGLSKTRTAEVLGIRRQSLYARLDRIEQLLGAPVEDPAQHVGLGVALAAWRMRTGLDPQAVPGPARG
jgi:purine catabolism regulator